MEAGGQFLEGMSSLYGGNDDDPRYPEDNAGRRLRKHTVAKLQASEKVIADSYRNERWQQPPRLI
jgi:hypothetical protein